MPRGREPVSKLPPSRNDAPPRALTGDPVRPAPAPLQAPPPPPGQAPFRSGNPFYPNPGPDPEPPPPPGTQASTLARSLLQLDLLTVAFIQNVTGNYIYSMKLSGHRPKHFLLIKAIGVAGISADSQSRASLSWFRQTCKGLGGPTRSAWHRPVGSRRRRGARGTCLAGIPAPAPRCCGVKVSGQGFLTSSPR